MNYEQFKNKYSAKLNDILNQVQDDMMGDCIEYGGDDWLDLLSIIWDGKDPYWEKPTQDEVSRVSILEKYIAEEYNIELV
jgi:hypothetical protein